MFFLPSTFTEEISSNTEAFSASKVFHQHGIAAEAAIKGVLFYKKNYS